jgi:tetratricopeptide (TPR) repeat protein
MDNIRAAIDFALGLEDFERVCQLANIYYWYFMDRYSEGRYYLEKALALPGARGVKRGKVLFAVGLLAFQQRDLHAATAYFEQCKTLSNVSDDKELIWDAFVGKGMLALVKGNITASQAYWEEALTLAEKLGNYYKITAQGFLGVTLAAQGSYEEARQIYEEAISLAQKENHWFDMYHLTYCQATLAIYVKDYQSLHNYLEKVIKIVEETAYSIGASTSGKCTALNWQAIAWASEGNFEVARQELEESLDMGLEGYLIIASWETLLGVVFLISRVWLKREQADLLEHVACLGGAMSDVDKKVGRVSGLSFQTYYAEALEVARSGLTESKFSDAFARGQEMTLEEALAYARQALNWL